ncbi:MAG: DUF2935 domain-containing protein [Firmicutes bacterium]|nr:DUF2935 domain-containing protein [Bacillota bacterium]
MNSPQCHKCLCEYNRLTEARFWTRILMEHALFIKLGLAPNETKLSAEAQGFVELFESLLNRLNRVKKLNPELLAELIEAVEAIIEFKAKVLRLIIQCEMPPGSNYPLLLDHIRREAERFLKLLVSPMAEDSLALLLQQEVFWLRIMKEHIEFIIHLLDPSERELLKQAHEFRKTFSRLLETARDLDSMAQTSPHRFNDVIQFTQNVIQHTRELRNFKAAAFELDEMCKILGIISDPLLLDHVRREADKFLSELDVLLPEVERCHSSQNR